MALIKNRDELASEILDEVNANKQAEQVLEPPTQMMQVISSLRKKWDASVRAKKNKIEQIFIENLISASGEYTPAKLAQIKELKASEAFIGITGTKVQDAKAWIRDALQKSWGVEPTPVPEMRPEIISEVNQKFISETIMKIQNAFAQAGATPNMNDIIPEIQSALPGLHDKIESELKAISWSKSREMEKEIDDKLVDGGWYDAIDECIPDLVIHGTGVVLGPLKRQKLELSILNSEIQVQQKIIESFDRVSVFDTYPQPDSSGPQDGWVFIMLHYRKMDLQKLIGVEGFDDKVILDVLESASKGNLREWALIDSERAEREKKNTVGVYDTDIIDCLLYMGPLSGYELSQIGVAVPSGQENYDFLANVWMIGNYIIKAMINEDPLGRQPIAVGHFDENVDGWWGNGVVRVMKSEQDICNACSRAVQNNVAMGSGPQVEINITRLKGGDRGDTRLIPWKRWITTGHGGMQTGKAIEFWQPEMHAAEITGVYKTFKQEADERSRIPAYYGHGEESGAPGTASGLSMLITQASRGIRGIIKCIGKTLIIPTIMPIYERLALDPKYKDKIGDVKLVAHGSQILVEREQRSVRVLEFLNATNNPTDMQLTGWEGRGYLLGEVCEAHDIDPEQALPKLSEMRNQPVIQPPPPGGAPTEGGAEIPNRGTPPVMSRNLAEGGMEPQGGAAQLFAGRGGSAEAAPTE